MADPRRIFEENRPNPGYCLVIRPMMRPEFDEFWDKVALAFHRTFAWKDVGRITKTGDIMDAVLQEMARSDVIVADISEERANVFYELGIAHAKKGLHKVILVAHGNWDESTRPDLPFDVSGMRFLPYEPKRGVDDFLRRLKGALFDTLEGTTWFHLPTNGTHRSPLMRGDDGNYRFEVTVRAITGAGLKDEGVDIELTVYREPSGGTAVEPTPVTLLLRDESRRTCAIPHLPWRLRSEGLDHSRGELEAVICMVPERR